MKQWQIAARDAAKAAVDVVADASLLAKAYNRMAEVDPDNEEAFQAASDNQAAEENCFAATIKTFFEVQARLGQAEDIEIGG